MVIDPEWEDKVETLAKQNPEHSFYDDQDSSSDDGDSSRDLRRSDDSDFDPVLAGRLERGEFSVDDLLTVYGTQLDRWPGWEYYESDSD